MEPMALGSPVGSPAAAAQSGNTSMYLPSFLMGEQQTPTTPRSNTLSPNKAGRNVSFGFAQSPGANSPQDYNRSHIGQKTLFGTYQDSPNTPLSARPLVGTPHNPVMSGPPTQGLFDSLKFDAANAQSPAFRNVQQGSMGTPNQSQLNLSHGFLPTQMNEPYYGNPNNSFNSSTRNVLPPNLNNSNMFETSLRSPQPLTIKESDFWVTVFGFPPSAMTSILQHFSQCGTIMDKVFPAQKGNWVHLKYSSRLECDKALNYNEKILANEIMIGVTHCKDPKVLGKENVVDNSLLCNTSNRARVRPLVQYSSENSVIASPSAPQKVSGIMNKAMDLLFNW